MLLPNKLFSYNQSILSKLPPLLRMLDEPQKPIDLYHAMQLTTDSPREFMEILDCLYALGKIDLDSEGRLCKC